MGSKNDISGLTGGNSILETTMKPQKNKSEHIVHLRGTNDNGLADESSISVNVCAELTAIICEKGA